MTVFYSLEAALKAGFHIFDRTDDGYLVRARLPNDSHGLAHWAFARVVLGGGDHRITYG